MAAHGFILFFDCPKASPSINIEAYGNKLTLSYELMGAVNEILQPA